MFVYLSIANYFKAYLIISQQLMTHHSTSEFAVDHGSLSEIKFLITGLRPAIARDASHADVRAASRFKATI